MMKSATRPKARGLPTAATSTTSSAKKSKTVPVAAAKKPRKVGTSNSKKPTPKVDRKKAAAKIHALNEASGGKNDRAAAIAAAVGRGVTMRPSRKWQAQLYYAGQSRYIGVFESREKATLAYEIAREILKGGKAPTQPGEAAEKAVEAARKAAFNGVNETNLAMVCSPEGAVNRDEPASPPKTPSTVASSTTSQNSEDKNSIKALKAAEILKGMFGVAVSNSSIDESDVGMEEEEEADEATEPVPSWIQQFKGKIPAWVEANRHSYGDRLVCAEWELIDYRLRNGWKGRDFMHDDESPVRIVEYFSNYGSGDGKLLDKGGEGTTLTGIVHFTRRAESHQGFCHGGSMTAVMDDVVGWAAFLATGSCQPWTGFTVQINTSLRKPIPVDSWLLVCGTISKIEGRKVSVMATLIDPANGDAVHAEGDGLVILNAGVLPGK